MLVLEKNTTCEWNELVVVVVSFSSGLHGRRDHIYTYSNELRHLLTLKFNVVVNGGIEKLLCFFFLRVEIQTRFSIIGYWQNKWTRRLQEYPYLSLVYSSNNR